MCFCVIDPVMLLWVSSMSAVVAALGFIAATGWVGVFGLVGARLGLSVV